MTDIIEGPAGSGSRPDLSDLGQLAQRHLVMSFTPKTAYGRPATSDVVRGEN